MPNCGSVIQPKFIRLDTTEGEVIINPCNIISVTKTMYSTGDACEDECRVNVVDGDYFIVKMSFSAFHRYLSDRGLI